jgi:hypothetical protein
MTSLRTIALVAAALAGPFAAVTPGHAFEPPRMVYVPPMPTVQMPEAQTQAPRWDNRRMPRAVETVPQTPPTQAADED